MQFLIGFCTSFAVGILLLEVVSSVEMVGLWLLALALGVGLVWRRKSSSFSTPLFISLCLVGLSLGLIRAELFSDNFGHSELEQSIGQTITVEGIVKQEPDYRENNLQLHVDTGEDVLLVTADRNLSIAYGDLVLVEGRLKEPEKFNTDLGRQFDYPKYLLVRSIEYRMSFAEVAVLESGQGSSIISWLLSAKRAFINSVEKVIPEPEVGLGAGLLLGVKSALGSDIEEDFRRSGIIHIVVLSGYNVMLVVAFIMFCFSFFLPLRARVIAGVVAIVTFALIVGLSATVVRASIMACLVLIATAYGKQYDVMRALLLAGLAMLVINPFLLYDIGFQLSFMATLGLLLILPRFETAIITDQRIIKLKEFFLATIATQVAVLPLLIYHIGEVSLIAVLVNVLVLPMVPVAMLLTFVVGLVAFLSVSLASVVGFVATFSLAYILKVSEVFSSLPFATVLLPEISWLEVGLMYLVLGVAIYFSMHRRRIVKDDFSDWVIEEEEKVAASLSEAATDERPVVFR